MVSVRYDAVYNCIACDSQGFANEWIACLVVSVDIHACVVKAIDDAKSTAPWYLQAKGTYPYTLFTVCRT
jgi:hypothetical protein